MNRYTLHNDDNLNVLRTMPDNSVDSIVTDPPYGLSFMGKKWDYDVPSVELWTECLRVLKPGGHLLAFAGTRTQHRMAVRIEDAGFEIRDMIAWVYGSGFPKSLDVSKAIDKAAGAERNVVVGSKLGRPGMAKDGSNQRSGFDAAFGDGDGTSMDHNIYAPATEAAHKWQGWGTSLKPSLEPVTVARKPFDTTVAENVLTHGTGALNIDGCRVATSDVVTNHARSDASAVSKGIYGDSAGQETHQTDGQKLGRWPANLIHDGSEDVVAGFPQTTSNMRLPNGGKIYGRNSLNESATCDTTVRGFSDSGSAARFFYCAKASKADRDEGCDSLPLGPAPGSKRSQPAEGRSDALGQPRANHHPTVKPTQLMQYLCRLVTPPNGIVLDPFMGSGSTGKAALLEGFRFIGIEREPAYMAIAERRISHASPEPLIPVGAKTDIEPAKQEQTDKGQLSLFGGK